MGRVKINHAVVFGMALFAAGCTGKPPKEPNEYLIALKGVSEEQMTPCGGLGEAPENQVGNLLQDFNDLSAACAPCRARHNSLVEYLRPLIEKAKADK